MKLAKDAEKSGATVKVEKTYRDVVTFINTAGPWIEQHKEESKFKYAIRKVLKQCSALWGHYIEQADDLDVEYCAVDKDGVIRKDAKGGFEFTKDGLKQRNAERRKLFESAVEVTPFLAKGVPLDLIDAEREAFAGFVLPHEDDEPGTAGAAEDEAGPRRVGA